MVRSVVLRRLVAGVGTVTVITISFISVGSLPLRGIIGITTSLTGSVLLYVSIALAAAIHRSYPEKHDSPRDTGTLFTEGPYSLCRHPFYLFLILVQASIPLIFLSFWGIIVITGFIPLWLLLVRIEEKELIEYWGSKYREYMEKTPAILPLLKKSGKRYSRNADE